MGYPNQDCPNVWDIIPIQIGTAVFFFDAWRGAWRVANLRSATPTQGAGQTTKLPNVVEDEGGELDVFSTVFSSPGKTISSG